MLLRTVVPALGLVLLLLAGTESTAAPVEVKVTVTSEDGQAVAAATVSVRVENEGNVELDKPVFVARGTTDGLGRVTLGVPPDARYTLVVTAPDPLWSQFADRCITGWKPADAEVQLQKANALKGAVLDPNKKPVPFARVNATLGTWTSSTFANEEGAFAFLNAPPGEATIYADIEQNEGDPIVSVRTPVKTNTRTAAVMLPSVPADPKAYILVRVRTPGGRPVMRAEATFSGHQTVIGPGTTHSTGFSSGTWVQGGAARSDDTKKRLYLEVIAAHSEYGEPLPSGPGRAGPFGPGARDDEMQLPQELALEGTVLGPSGEPLPNIRVAALPRGTPPDAGPNFSTWTDAAHGQGVSGSDGRFRIGGLEKRKYELLPWPTRAYVGYDETHIPAGTMNAEVHMWRALNPTLMVRDESGAAVVGALVKLYLVSRDPFFDVAGRDLEAESDTAGRARVEALDPKAKYRLVVHPPAERDDLLVWEDRDWSPQSTTLTLEQSQQISGVVEDQDGQPVPLARLTWFRIEKGASKPVKSRGKASATGTFQLLNLRPGKYGIQVRVPRGVRDPLKDAPKKKSARSRKGKKKDSKEPDEDEETGPKPHVVKAGSYDVVLELAMPSTLTLRLRAYTKKLGKPDILLAAPKGKEGTGPSLVKKKLGKEGRVVFEGLRWNVQYVIWMGGLKDGKYVYEEGLQPQARKLELRLMKGKTITGVAEGPKGVKSRRVWAVFPGFEVKAKMKSGGRFEITGVPPGPWKLRATGKLGKVELTGEATCEPDAEASITLSAR